MKLYHYAPIDNTCLQDGILSISKNPVNLKSYFKRAGSEDKKEILAWLDQTFEGRSRAISCLTEPIKWQGHDPGLKTFAELDLFSFELDDLLKDGLIDTIWCKNGSDAQGKNEKFFKVLPNDIDCSPLPWDKVCFEKGLFFAVIRHYFLVLTKGYIPPKYITLEKK